MKTRRWLLWWEERLTAWGEISAGIWAVYWLLLIGAFLVLGGVVLKWVEFPFSNNLSGLELPLLNAGGVIPHVSLFSFGAIGVILLLMGLWP